MPSLTNFARLARLASLPATRSLIGAALDPGTLREVAQRAVHDRAGLIRDLRNRPNARDLVRTAVRHPVTLELANAGLLFLPGRYLPLGWAATWATRRVVGRYFGQPGEELNRPG
jgi:hypothetical protein